MQGRVNPELEQWDECPSGPPEGLPGERDEAAEELLKALESLGDAFVVGREARWVPPFALGGEGHEDAEGMFRAEFRALGECVGPLLPWRFEVDGVVSGDLDGHLAPG